MNDEKEAFELRQLTAKYRFLVMLKEGKARKGWWGRICSVQLQMKIDTVWREMLTRIPVDHNIAIDQLLQQSNITHYGN